jgi:hypothetical protein
MNSKTWTRIIALALFAALAIPTQLTAQNDQDHAATHRHYKLIDLGTFGISNDPSGGAQITESSAPASGAKFAPTEMITRYRSALTRRNQRFGALTQK